jgi:hypothetical protein
VNLRSTNGEGSAWDRLILRQDYLCTTKRIYKDSTQRRATELTRHTVGYDNCLEKNDFMELHIAFL